MIDLEVNIYMILNVMGLTPYIQLDDMVILHALDRLIDDHQTQFDYHYGKCQLYSEFCALNCKH